MKVPVKTSKKKITATISLAILSIATITATAVSSGALVKARLALGAMTIKHLLERGDTKYGLSEQEQLAELYLRAGMFSNAVVAYEALLPDLSRHYGSLSWQLAEAYAELSKAYMQCKAFGEARLAKQQSIGIMYALDAELRGQEDFRAENQLLNHCLAICRRAFGSDSPEYVRFLQLAALNCLDRKQCQEAIDLLNSSLKAQVNQVDLDSLLSREQSVHLLIRAYGIVKNDEELERAYSNLISLREQRMQKTDPFVLYTSLDRAQYWKARKDYQRAVSWFEKFRLLRKNYRGAQCEAASYSTLSDALVDLAACLKAEGKIQESEALSKQVLSTLMSPGGSGGLASARYLFDLGANEWLHKDNKQAEPHLEKAMAILQSSHCANDVNYARLLHTLARCYAEDGKYSLAIPLFSRTLEIEKRSLKPSDPMLVEANFDFGNLYLMQAIDANKKLKKDDSMKYLSIALEFFTSLDKTGGNRAADTLRAAAQNVPEPDNREFITRCISAAITCYKIAGNQRGLDMLNIK